MKIQFFLANSIYQPHNTLSSCYDVSKTLHLSHNTLQQLMWKMIFFYANLEDLLPIIISKKDF